MLKVGIVGLPNATDEIHYLNGQWVDSEDLKISAFDLSVTRGFGVFDFLRTYNNKPFMLKEHINRFFYSLKILKMESVKTRKEIEEIVKKGIKRNGFSETNIKIIQTGGMSDDGITPNGRYGFIAMFTPATKYPISYYEKGIKLITAPMGRMYTEAKSLDYMTGVLALMEAKKKKEPGSRTSIYCLMSDGEQDAGNTWEAAMLAGKLRLDNLTAVIMAIVVLSIMPGIIEVVRHRLRA